MKTKTIWIIIGLIAVIFLITKFDFLGSVMTSCENNEPVTMLEYEAATAMMNGTFSEPQLFNLIQGNGSISFPKRTSNTKLGEYEYIDTTGTISCEDLLELIKIEDNTTTFTTLSKRTVLLTSTSVMWCNNEGTITLKSSITGFSNYFAEYETCTEIVVEDLPPLPTNNYAKPITTEPIKQTETTPTQKTQNPLWFVLAGITALILIYVIFEKGPKKGLIRKRR